ncbi:hypothetical protein WI99_33495 [Burkholderia cepacia]|nr:hypothetical protein WI99_33495 [Burkholderia cepacia]
MHVTPDQITDRLVHSLRMLGDHDDVDTIVTVHVQLFDVFGGFYRGTYWRPVALHLVNDQHITWLHTFPPSAYERLVDLNVIDCQIANTIHKYSTSALRQLVSKPDCPQRFSGSRYSRN